MLNWDDPLRSTSRELRDSSMPPPADKARKRLPRYPAVTPVTGTGSASPGIAEPGGDYQDRGGASGLEAPQLGSDRLRKDDKRIINCRADINQLLPIRYDWAYQKYLHACRRHWLPQQVDMAADIAQWQDATALTEDERNIVKRNLGFFATTGSLVANHLVLGVYRHITNAECRQYLLRQAYEESLHTQAYQYLVETLGLDQGEIFNMYREVPAVAHKAEWALPFTRHLSEPGFHTGSLDADRHLLRELVAFYVVLEGLFLHVGFTQILSMGRRNKMTGTAQLFAHILQDTSMHMHFGIDMINQIKIENPQLWDEGFRLQIEQMIRDAVTLETRYAYDSMPRGILGLNAPMFEEYLQFTANRRCAQIGLGELYPGAGNPFPWMAEMLETDLPAAAVAGAGSAPHGGDTLDWD